MPAPQSSPPGGSESASTLLGRAYYLHLGLMENELRRAGIGREVRPGMCNVLFALYENDDQSISSIARHVRVAKSTMTATVERLKRAGLVEARPDPSDRRSQLLRLTNSGKGLEPKLRGIVASLESEVCRSMNRDESEQFRELLKRAIQGMGSLRD